MKIKGLNILILGLAILLQGNAAFGQKPQFEDLFISGVQSFTSGKYGESINTLKKAEQLRPDDAAVQYYLGLCEYARSSSDKARAYLKRAVELDGDNFYYKFFLARVTAFAGESEEAIHLYEQLVKEHPNEQMIFYELMNLYSSSGQEDKALTALDEYEAIGAASPNTAMARYSILLRKGKTEEAYNLLRETAEDYPTPQLYTILGDFEMNSYRDSSAIRWYNEALDIDKDYGPALLGKVEALRISRNWGMYFSEAKALMNNDTVEGDAKASYLRAILQQSDPSFVRGFATQIDTLIQTARARNDRDSSLLQVNAMYHYLFGNDEKASEILRQGMEMYPESASATGSYLQSLGILSQWEALAREADSAVVRFPDERAFLEISSAAYYNLKDYDKVIENSMRLFQSAKSKEDAVKALATIGDAYHNKGDEKTAFKIYEKALKLDPDYVLVLNNYAYYLSLKGKKLKKALAMSKKTIEQEPDNATYLDTYAWILHLLGRNNEAKAYFKHAMLYGGKDSATIMNHYATVLEELGETDLAASYRRQAAGKGNDAEQ